MKDLMMKLGRGTARTLGAVWRSTSALIAMALIIGAFALGVWIATDRDNDEPDAAEVAHAHPDAPPARQQMYTCSMHPSVRLPDPDAKCPICFMDLIPVGVEDEEEGAQRRLRLTHAAAKLAEIETLPAQRFYPEAHVRMTGRIEFDETRLARIAAYFPGRIERLHVNFTGARVRRGEPLAEVYSPELLAAQEELRQSARSVRETEQASPLVRRATEATLDAARDRLRLWGIDPGQIEAIEEGETTLERLTVRAPMSGIVIERAVSEGEYVKTGETLYKVADLSRVWVMLEAFESQLPLLRHGQQVRFTGDWSPGREITGRISFVDPVLDRDARVARLRVDVDNADGVLKPGMFVRGVAHARIAAGGVVIADDLAGKWVSPVHPEIVSDEPGVCDITGAPLVPAEQLGYVTDAAEAEPPVVIPASAPLITGRRAVVYVRLPDRDDPTFEGREVRLGLRAGDFYIVEQGLREGEEVVVHGAFKIDSAMQIAAKPSMMDPAGDAPPPEHHHHHEQEHTHRVEIVPEQFLMSLTPVYAAYFDAQEALAADDPGGFDRALDDLRLYLELVRPAGLIGHPLGEWRRISSRLRSASDAAAASDDIEDKRAHFETHSRAVLDLQEWFGHRGEATFYRTHCPMAFDDRGADWLARSDRISNPYFGAQMLRCGEIVREHAGRNGRPGGAR